MAIDQLIEDGDNYYYVDINGVMASNQWVAIENEDAGDDNEPEHYWYYFQANGKALTNGDDTEHRSEDHQRQEVRFRRGRQDVVRMGCRRQRRAH